MKLLDIKSAAKKIVLCIKSRRCVIACIGSELRSDDRFALELCRHLLKSTKYSIDNVVLCEYGLEFCLGKILDLDPEKILILDTVISGRASPASFLSIDFDDIVDVFTVSTHSIPMKRLLELLRVYLSHPIDIEIIGVEAESLDIGEELSIELKKALDRLVNEVLKLLES